MDLKKLVAICRHELRLDEDCDIARLITEVKVAQGDASDHYATLTKERRVPARETMSGYMLAWEYVEDMDGQRFWKKKFRPDTLIWPEDKQKWCAITSFKLNLLIYARILAGVEKMFNELQDYSTIDRQKRKSRPTPKIYKEADAGDDPSTPVAQLAIRQPTKQSGRRDNQSKSDVTPVPDNAAPTAQDTELGEQASRPKEELKKAAGMESYNAEPKRQLEVPLTDDSNNGSAEESPSKKRALTPPYIPEKGLHQTWPDFGFKSVSKEGARALRNRTVEINDFEEWPSRNTLMTPRGSKSSRAMANRTQDSAEKHVSTVPAATVEEGHINDQDLKRTWKRRLPSLPDSLLTRHQAASAKAADNHNPTSENDSVAGEASLSAVPRSDGRAVEATAVQKS